MPSAAKTPRQCYLCGEGFSKTKPATRSHVVTRRWFGDPPPDNLPTLLAHRPCNERLSPAEERIRNALVHVNSHDPEPYQQVLDKSSRSLQPLPKTVRAGYEPNRAGILVPTMLVELPKPEDIELVFGAITRGCYRLVTGNFLPQDVPVHSVLLQKQHADTVSKRMFTLTPGCLALGNFLVKPVMKADNPADGVWLYLVFDAGVVASHAGEAAVKLNFQPAQYALGSARP